MAVPGVNCRPVFQLHCHQKRRPIRLGLEQYRPCDMSQFVGEGNRHDVGVSTRDELSQPLTETRLSLFSALQYRAGSMYEESSQVLVSALADPKQSLLAAG